jgi:CO/xanthine dehydrogenase Mo-binding subunit
MTTSKIGAAVPRLEGKAMVKGTLKYASDMSIPGMLFGKTHRSPHPHARIKRIDTTRAEQLPGVVAIVTAEDVEGINLHGRDPMVDQPVLVAIGDVARMVGDPIVAVAAESEKIAEEAANLIEIEYEVLDPIDDPEKVLQAPEDHLIHETAFCGEFDIEKGNPAEGINEADVIVEATYVLPRQEHSYIETESCVVIPEYDGTLAVVGCSQDPHYSRYSISQSLGMRENQVRFVTPPMGGSFGGKQSITVHIICAILAQKTGRPVKMVLTRDESMIVSVKRHPGRVRHRIGATRKGKLTFIEVDYLLDGGPYGWATPGVTFLMGEALISSYDVPHVSIRGRGVYTTNPMSGAFRGFGVLQGTTVTELQIDRLARKLQIDAAEIRRLNFRQDDETDPANAANSELVLSTALDEAGEFLQINDSGKLRGRGISFMRPLFDISSVTEQDCRGTGATIEMLRDGSVEVRSGVVEMGTGITTTLAQITASELGVPIDEVRVVSGDSQRTIKQGPTLGSRSAYASGNAVKLAVEELRNRLAMEAARHLGDDLDEKDIKFENGMAVDRNDQARAVNIKELTNLCFTNGINLSVDSWFVTDHAEDGHSQVAAVVDVEVAVDTGEVSVLQCIIAHNCGKVLSPLNARGQLIGGALQGIGYALMEEVVALQSEPKTESLTDYLIPTALDAPNIKVFLLEEPYPTGPYGARGLAEHGTDVLPAALLNAVARAIEKEIETFPVTPPRVYNLIHAHPPKNLEQDFHKREREEEISP